MEERNSFSELLQSLNFKSSKVFLGLVESELIHFVNEAKKKDTKRDKEITLEFPCMTGHFRYLIHNTAARFQLKSASNGWGYDRSTTVKFTTESSIPILNYRDFQPHYEEPLSIDDRDFIISYISKLNSKPLAPIFTSSRKLEESPPRSEKRTADDTLIENPTKKPKDDSGSEGKKGRGSFTFDRMSSKSEASKPSILSQLSFNTAPVEFQDEDIELINKYDEYDAEKIRQEEDQVFRKANAEINNKKPEQYLWSDAWALWEPGNGLVSFQVNTLESLAGLRVALSNHRGNSSGMYEFVFFQENKNWNVKIVNKGKDLMSCKLSIQEAPAKLWILVRSEEITIGQGTFFENYEFLQFQDRSISNLSFVGWSNWERNMVVHSIYISKRVSSVSSSRDHLLELEMEGISNELIEQTIVKDVERIVQIKENKAVIVMKSVKAAFNLIRNPLKFRVSLLRFSSHRNLVEFSSEEERPETNTRTARRLIGVALKQ